VLLFYLYLSKVVPLLNKMQLQSEKVFADGEPRILVSVPPTRSDILHARDVVEVRKIIVECIFLDLFLKLLLLD
jgi:phenylalanyl-tRNA synthetase beta subunit